MTTRSVEELRRQLRGRPEFQPRIREERLRPDLPIARVPARRTFQDFVPDYAQAAGASSLPSRAAGALSMRRLMPRTPDYVQAARMAAGRPPVRSTLGPYDTGGLEDVAPGFRAPTAQRVRPSPPVPDYVQAANRAVARATVPAHEAPFAPWEPYDPPTRARATVVPPLPPTATPMPIMPPLSWREFVSEDPPIGPRRPQPPRFSINAGGLPIPFHSALAAEPWPYGRFENLQRGAFAAPVPNRFRGLGFDEWYRQLTLPHSAYRSAVWAPMGPVGNTGAPWGV